MGVEAETIVRTTTDAGDKRIDHAAGLTASGQLIITVVFECHTADRADELESDGSSRSGQVEGDLLTVQRTLRELPLRRLRGELTERIEAVAAAMAMTVRAGRALDHWVQGVGLALYSVPAFWLGLMLIMLLSRKLGWFPAGGMQAPDADYLGGWARLADLLHHLALPVITLAVGTGRCPWGVAVSLSGA